MQTPRQAADTPACCTREYDVMDASDRVYRLHADTPEQACQQAADLYRVDIIAWRHPPTALLVGTSAIVG